MISKKLRQLSFLIFCAGIISFNSCDGEATPPEEINIDQLKAQITAVTDAGNLGNASDIRVEFTGSTVSGAVGEYRIIVVASSEASSMDVTTASALAQGRYLSVAGDRAAYSEMLRANHQDANGNTIELASDYKVMILSVGTLNDEPAFVLSEASEDISLVNLPETTTLVSNLQANDALSIDADGNVYVSNYGAYNNTTNQGDGSTVLKVTPAGAVSTFATGLANPVGNAVDAEGNLYVNDDNNFVSGNVVKVAPDGSKTLVATVAGYPAGMLYGPDGHLYVSNYGRGVVSRVTTDGTVTDFATDDRLQGGVGMAYDPAGNILVGNSITGEVLSISPGGDVSLIGTVPSVEPRGVISYITFFEGHVYATGSRAQVIYKVSLTGQVTILAGSGVATSADGELLSASFLGPNGIVADKDRKLLYVSEANNGSAKLRVIPLD